MTPAIPLAKEVLELMHRFEGVPERPYVPVDKKGRPLVASGITIGMGEDLGHRSADAFKAEWDDSGLKPEYVLELATVCGLKGDAALRALPQVKYIRIPSTVAMNMFLTVSWPKWAAKTVAAFPGLDIIARTHPVPAGALVSCLYNRGDSVPAYDENDPRTWRREELDHIRDLVAEGSLDKIAARLVISARHHLGIKGLVKRRLAEAALVWPEIVKDPDYLTMARAA